ncbi:MAG: DNRLRE domain-containing protein [Bacteroidota bacterium]
MKFLRYTGLVLSMTLFLFTSCKKDCPDTSIVVDAGIDQQVVLPVNTANLTGTVVSGGTAADVYLWVQLSGPNTAAITNSSSLTADVSGLVAGTYVFQLQGTNSHGETDLDTITIVVLPPAAGTIVLQPASNPAEGSFMTINPASWSSGVTQIFMGAWTYFGNFFAVRCALKFDYSALPAGAVIDNATLTLYSDPAPENGNKVDAQDGPTNSFHIKRITSAWANYTWNSQPTSTDVNSVAVPQSASATENVVANVTNIVKDQLTSGNNGFSMALDNEVIYNIRQFASSYVPNAALHPKLVISYH